MTRILEMSSILPHTKSMPKILINVNANMNSKNASKKMNHRKIKTKLTEVDKDSDLIWFKATVKYLEYVEMTKLIY